MGDELEREKWEENWRTMQLQHELHVMKSDRNSFFSICLVLLLALTILAVVPVFK